MLDVYHQPYWLCFGVRAVIFAMCTARWLITEKADTDHSVEVSLEGSVGLQKESVMYFRPQL